MVYGDHGGAVGYLIGEENNGMACMFTMMNRARLAVGLQGVGIAERATQQALAYARERKAGRGRGNHRLPGCQTHAAHHACVDRSRACDLLCDRDCDRSIMRAKSDTERKSAHERASLLTPVAKAFSTDIGSEVASLGIQVHGGMGYVEETGAAQHYRDARIAAIYEGTNGIQALDLVTRKVPLEGGKTVELYIDELRHIVTSVQSSNAPEFGETATRLREAVDSLERTNRWLLAQKASDAALAGATPYLRLFGNTAGGCMLAEQALASLRAGDGIARTVLARFFAENIAVQANGLERSVTEGAGGITGAQAALAE